MNYYYEGESWYGGQMTRKRREEKEKGDVVWGVMFITLQYRSRPAQRQKSLNFPYKKPRKP